MDMKLLVLFIILSLVNVILQTMRGILTISGTKFVSAIANAIAYGVYTVVIIYTTCALPLWAKIIITAVTNFVGVYISKWILDKMSKDKLWKVEIAVEEKYADKVATELTMPKNYTIAGKWAVFNCYCYTQAETEMAVKTCKKYNGKISAYESKL